MTLSVARIPVAPLTGHGGDGVAEYLMIDDLRTAGLDHYRQDPTTAARERGAAEKTSL